MRRSVSIVHRYDAAGNRLTTNYYTRKVATTVPLGNTLTGTSNTTNYNVTRDAFHNNIVYTANNNDAYGIEFVHNPEGYIRYLTPEEHYHFYYIKDLLGNIRETYIHPEAGYKECVQRMQYYPSGLPWLEAYSPSEQPYKYNGKEFVEMHGLDEYDSKARWYYPAICRTTTMDPLAETYYPTSPYAWCGNNTMRFVDPDGMKIIIGDSTSQVEYISGQDYLGDNDYIAEVYSNLSLLEQDHLDVALMINELEESSLFHYIKPTTGFNQIATNTYKNKNNIPQGTIVEYNPWNWMTVNEDIRPPRIGLVHELKHAWDANAGQLDNKTLIQGVPISELNAIRVENLIRVAMNEPLRKTFKNIIIDEKYLK